MTGYLGKRIAGSVARHVLTAAGGWAVAQGYVDESTAQTLIGAGVTLVGVLWGATEKMIRT